MSGWAPHSFETDAAIAIQDRVDREMNEKPPRTDVRPVSDPTP